MTTALLLAFLCATSAAAGYLLAYARARAPGVARPSLIAAAHLTGMPPTGHPEEDAAYAALVRTAEAFLRAGGAVSLADLAGLLPEERVALAVAAERLAADRAAALGLAAQGPLGAAEVLAAVDGGAARRRVLLERAAAGGGP